ncbi:MAG TPA: DUF4123 domain-containing protein [Pseudomonas sp.]|jgi:hypothetical protein
MTATHINKWFDLLEASCAQLSITCLDIIIDQSGSDTPLLPSVLSVEPAMPWHSLFTGLPEEGHEDVAPLLVHVDLAQPLQRQWLIGLMRELEGRDLLLVLASLWPFPLLAKHLGGCVEASNGGNTGLLRYYDPRLFPLLFSHVLQPDQQQRWLRPVVFWSWLDRDGAPIRLSGIAETPATTNEDLKPIELTDNQLEIFCCASEATILVQDLPPGPGAEQRFQICYAALLEATAAGVLVDTEREALALVKLRNAEPGWAQTGRTSHD